MIQIQYVHHVQFNTMGSKPGCYTKGVVKYDRTLTALGGNTMLWHQRLGISEKRAFEQYKVKVWLNIWLVSLCIFISVNVAYMENKTE